MNKGNIVLWPLVDFLSKNVLKEKNNMYIGTQQYNVLISLPRRENKEDYLNLEMTYNLIARPQRS